MTLPAHPPLPGEQPPGRPAPTDTAQALFSGLIDYAGLFPPAKLDMASAVRNYAAYLRGPGAWMLGRFICPVSRLEEFCQAAREWLPRPVPGRGAPSAAADPADPEAPDPWPISALIDGDLEEDLDAVFAFNREHTGPERGLAVVDAVEIKVASPAEIDAALDRVPDELFPFFEIGSAPGLLSDPRGLAAALAGCDAAAKVRTGGVVPEAFPSAAQLAEFLLACDAADVPFKATAGLHHVVRGEHPLTYEPDCPRGVMHGFVNLFLAAAFVREGNIVAPDVVAMLEERDAERFRFTDQAVCWRNRQLEVAHVAGARESFALSFGSCSFDEPAQELGALGWV
ncbi:MAG TPA: hypothetical protein VD963_03435 [Phycisphaerales bacterium]|nr:hypothetical protein [Phycisphaerales bacterium]